MSFLSTEAHNEDDQPITQNVRRSARVRVYANIIAAHVEYATPQISASNTTRDVNVEMRANGARLGRRTLGGIEEVE